MNIRLVTVDNRYVATVKTNQDCLDVIVYDGAYYIPTGIEWFAQTCIFQVYRRANAEVILNCDAIIDPLDQLET